MIIISTGLGPMMALATALIVGNAPADRAGAASAVASTAPQLGGGLGIAILGSIIAAIYRARMNGGSDDTLAGAVETAATLPPTEAADLLAAARQAFTTGFTISAWTAAAATLLLAVAVLTVLSRTRST